MLAAVADLHRSTRPAPSPRSQIPPFRVEPKGADAPVMWSHFRLVERIGRGAFGEVYRAWDTRLDREVALKLLPTDRSSGERASAIIHEGRLLARVRHPNVVTLYGAEQIEDRIGLSMEFVRGQTLEQILDDRKVVSAKEAVDIGARALWRDNGGARCRLAASRYQGAQRDANRRRPHRADGLRHRQRAHRRRIV